MSTEVQNLNDSNDVEKFAQEEIEKALKTLGNGDFVKGRNTILLLATRMAFARKKHPKFGGMRCIMSEVGELIYATDHETHNRAKDEAIDVITTLIRFLNNE